MVKLFYHTNENLKKILGIHTYYKVS